MNYCKENVDNKTLKEARILLVEDDPDHAELIIDVLKFIKNNANFSSIPIIILSTSSDQETIDEAFNTDFHRC